MTYNPDPNKQAVEIIFDNHTHLGLTLDSKQITLMRKYTLLKTHDQIYKILVRPHLDYFNVIYHIPDIIDSLILQSA